MELICDTLRAASMNYDDPHQVEEVLEKQLEANLHHAMHSSHALQSIADGMPALGIVAAVLGVIKTMGSIDQPPEILGGMIGSALVGTFMGVFMAYGLVGPFAARVKAVVEEDAHFMKLDPRSPGCEPAPPSAEHLHRGRPPEYAPSEAAKFFGAGTCAALRQVGCRMRWRGPCFATMFMVALALSVPAADAEIIPVRSGEHEDFTRLVVDLPERTKWEFGRNSAGYELRVPGKGIVFDLAGVFARIPRTRLADLETGKAEGSLALGVTCDCHAMVSESRSGSIIIDIRQGPAPESSPFELQLAEAGGGAAAKATPLSHPQSGSFEAGPGASAKGTLIYRPNQNQDASLPIYWRDVEAAQAGANNVRNGGPSGHPDPATLPGPSRLPVAALADANAERHAIRPVTPELPGDSGATARLGLPELPGPETAETERELLLQLGRAAAQGLIALELDADKSVERAPATPGPIEAAGEPWPAKPEARGTPAKAGTVHVETAMDRDARGNSMALHSNAVGQTCVPDEALAIADWGGVGDAAQQIAAARAGLVGEFDRPEPAAVERLARLYLHLGMGAEARQVLAAFDVEITDAGLLNDIALVLDGLPVPESSALPDMADCGGAVAMWGLIAASELAGGG